MRSLMISTPKKYCSGDIIENNEMGGACTKYGGEKRCIQDFGGERDQLKEPGVDESIIFRRIFRKWNMGPLTGSMWLRIGTGGGLL
jgi:hypothetical protein